MHPDHYEDWPAHSSGGCYFFLRFRKRIVPMAVAERIRTSVHQGYSVSGTGSSCSVRAVVSVGGSVLSAGASSYPQIVQVWAEVSVAILPGM